MNSKLMILSAFLLAVTTASSNELLNKQTKALCFNGLYNRITQPKTDVDCFFKKEYTTYLNGLVSWEYDVLKDDLQHNTGSNKIRCVDLLLDKVPADISAQRKAREPFHARIANDGPSLESIRQKLNPTTAQYITNYILSTIKSDLGYGPKSFKRSTLLAQLCAGVRLGLYDFCGRKLFRHAFNHTANFINQRIITINTRPVPEQFPEIDTSSRQFHVQSIIIAPIVEELLFTILPTLTLNKAEEILNINMTPGERLVRTVNPLLFGLAHYSNHPIRWAFQTMSCALSSYKHISYLQNNPQNILVPIIAHATSNTLGLYNNGWFSSKKSE